MENLERNCSYRIMFLFHNDILAFELGELCPGVGILFRVFDAECCTEKLSPGRRF